jgi:pimeloyl-ACP methyl ester carboxylesterase
VSADAALARHGLRLHVSDAGGTGTPVVFQHGLCGDAGQSTEVFPEDRRFRRLTLECRGHGGSELGSPSAFSIATFADDVAALIEDRARPPCIVGGISMGAAISLRLAVKRSDLVRALVLARPAWVTAAAPDNMAPNALVGSLLASHAPDEARARFRASETHAPLAREAPDNLASLEGFFARAPLDVTAELLTRISADGPGVSEDEVRAIVVPTLVIATARDFIHPLAHAAALAGLIPGARLVTITPKAESKPRYLAEFRKALACFFEEIIA